MPHKSRGRADAKGVIRARQTGADRLRIGPDLCPGVFVGTLIDLDTRDRGVPFSLASRGVGLSLLLARDNPLRIRDLHARIRETPIRATDTTYRNRAEQRMIRMRALHIHRRRTPRARIPRPSIARVQRRSTRFAEHRTHVYTVVYTSVYTCLVSHR